MHVRGYFVSALFADWSIARLAVANGEITKHVRHGSAVRTVVSKVATDEPFTFGRQVVAVARADSVPVVATAHD